MEPVILLNWAAPVRFLSRLASTFKTNVLHLGFTLIHNKARTIQDAHRPRKCDWTKIISAVL